MEGSSNLRIWRLTNNSNETSGTNKAGLQFKKNVKQKQWARKFKKVQARKTREINFTKKFFDQIPFFDLSYFLSFLP